MRIDTTEVIRDLDGDPVEMDQPKPTEVGERPKAVTLKHVLVTALSTPQGDQYRQEAPEVKFRRGFLALQIHTNDEVELSAEDVVMLKNLVAASYAPLVVYRAHLALEGKNMNPERPTEE